jgi:hypothetical protein
MIIFFPGKWNSVSGNVFVFERLYSKKGATNFIRIRFRYLESEKEKRDADRLRKITERIAAIDDSIISVSDISIDFKFAFDALKIENARLKKAILNHRHANGFVENTDLKGNVIITTKKD